MQVGERTLVVQFNPGRTVNSTAKVDAATIEKRPCFLCAGNLPPEEKGLAFGPDLVILANPFPILDHQNWYDLSFTKTFLDSLDVRSFVQFGKTW